MTTIMSTCSGSRDDLKRLTVRPATENARSDAADNPGMDRYLSANGTRTL
jgi:hypothetical protein